MKALEQLKITKGKYMTVLQRLSEATINRRIYKSKYCKSDDVIYHLQQNTDYT